MTAVIYVCTGGPYVLEYWPRLLNIYYQVLFITYHHSIGLVVYDFITVLRCCKNFGGVWKGGHGTECPY